MHFASPGYFALLALVPLLWWWELKKKRPALRYSDTGLLPEPAPVERIISRLPLVLYSLALVFITVALARPQKGRQFEELETRGIDIVLCLDISGSMQALDFAPGDRLSVAKERAKEFVSKRKGDRIGLVVFSATSLTQCPLTLDHKIVTDIIDRLRFGILEDGTAIGMGLASAVARLKDSKAKEKVIILLTDGVNNTGDIDPLTAAQTAAALGIKVYTIGVGSKGPVPFPIDDPIFGRRYVQVEVDLDTETLQRIADITGGKFFLATDPQALKRIYDEIDRLEPSTFKTRRWTVYQERAQMPMLWALISLLAGSLSSMFILRRLV
ncbi:MAG: VWA domain-containing protein [candidate division WOR-3 bacterium]|nr:VWA domain-containing protein [candidate division WOR-3 bacterium]